VAETKEGETNAVCCAETGARTVLLGFAEAPETLSDTADKCESELDPSAPFEEWAAAADVDAGVDEELDCGLGDRAAAGGIKELVDGDGLMPPPIPFTMLEAALRDGLGGVRFGVDCCCCG
jgi:hypothetical protein